MKSCVLLCDSPLIANILLAKIMSRKSDLNKKEKCG